MSKEYETLKRIYDENEGLLFNLAVEYLIENGYKNFRELTDEQIENQKAPNLIDDEFFKQILRVAREIAQETNPINLLQFTIVEKTVTLNGFYVKKRRK